MNFGELKSRVAMDLHRTDLVTEIVSFIETARIQLNTRFNLALIPFVDDADTDIILDPIPELYVYAALAEGYTFLHNGDAKAAYWQDWNTLADKQNIQTPGGPTDPFTQAPVIQIYIPDDQ